MNPKQAYAAIWKTKLADNQAPADKQSIPRVTWTAALFPDDPAAGPLLDLGCGSGAMLAEAKWRGWKAMGTDIDPAVVDWLVHQDFDARENNIDTDPEFHVWVGESHYGIVTACDVIEHLIDPGHMLAEAFRVLRPGGRLYVGTPNCAHWRRIRSLIVGQMFRTSGDEILKDGGHLGYWGPVDLVAALKAAGFSAVQLHYRNEDLPPSTWYERAEWFNFTYLIVEGRKP